MLRQEIGATAGFPLLKALGTETQQGTPWLCLLQGTIDPAAVWPLSEVFCLQIHALAAGPHQQPMQNQSLSFPINGCCFGPALSLLCELWSTKLGEFPLPDVQAKDNIIKAGCGSLSSHSSAHQPLFTDGLQGACEQDSERISPFYFFLLF